MSETDATNAAPPAPVPQPPLPFAFTASGSEYFRIWIVNLLLTILTLGIYSAWAKVRRTKYFYHNTFVDGSSFEYHGRPLAILKGRLIALGLLVAYNLLIESHSGLATAAALVLLGLAAPWLLWKSLQFRAWNSSWRGVRFGFGGTRGEAYVTFLLWPLIALISFYTMFPLAHHQIKHWQHNRARFGATAFSMTPCIGGFFGTYLIGFAVFFAVIVSAVLMVVVGAGVGSLFDLDGDALDAFGVMAALGVFAMVYLVFLALWPALYARLANLVWSNTRLGPHAFQCRIPLQRAVVVGVTNVLGIVLSLGLFIPWASVRWARLRIEHLSLLPVTELDEFVSDAQAQAGAAGEGLADLGDFDIGL